MSIPCSVCAHAQVEEINGLILSHTPLRSIASHVPGTTRSALGRHRKHVGGLLVRAVARIAAPQVEAAEVEAYEDGLLSKVSRLEADARRIGERAEREGDLRAALVANAGLLNVVKLLHELLPSSEADPVVKVTFSFADSGASRDAEAFEARQQAQREAATPSTAGGPESGMPPDDEAAQPIVAHEERQVEKIVAAPSRARDVLWKAAGVSPRTKDDADD